MTDGAAGGQINQSGGSASTGQQAAPSFKGPDLREMATVYPMKRSTVGDALDTVFRKEAIVNRNLGLSLAFGGVAGFFFLVPLLTAASAGTIELLAPVSFVFAALSGKHVTLYKEHSHALETVEKNLTYIAPITVYKG